MCQIGSVFSQKIFEGYTPDPLCCPYLVVPPYRRFVPVRTNHINHCGWHVNRIIVMLKI